MSCEGLVSRVCHLCVPLPDSLFSHSQSYLTCGSVSLLHCIGRHGVLVPVLSIAKGGRTDGHGVGTSSYGTFLGLPKLAGLHIPTHLDR